MFYAQSTSAVLSGRCLCERVVYKRNDLKITETKGSSCPTVSKVSAYLQKFFYIKSGSWAYGHWSVDSVASWDSGQQVFRSQCLCVINSSASSAPLAVSTVEVSTSRVTWTSLNRVNPSANRLICQCHYIWSQHEICLRARSGHGSNVFCFCIWAVFLAPCFIELLMFYRKMYWMFYVTDEPEGKFLYTETIKLYCTVKKKKKKKKTTTTTIPFREDLFLLRLLSSSFFLLLFLSVRSVFKGYRLPTSCKST